TLRRCAAEHGDRARLVDAYGDGLVPELAGGRRRWLDAHADADTEVPALLASGLLLLAELVVADLGHRPLECLGRGDGMAVQPRRPNVRKLVILEDVLATELEWVHADPSGHDVEHGLADDVLEHPGTPVGALAARVRHGRFVLEADLPQVVRTA